MGTGNQGRGKGRPPAPGAGLQGSLGWKQVIPGRAATAQARIGAAPAPCNRTRKLRVWRWARFREGQSDSLRWAVLGLWSGGGRYELHHREDPDRRQDAAGEAAGARCGCRVAGGSVGGAAPAGGRYAGGGNSASGPGQAEGRGRCPQVLGAWEVEGEVSWELGLEFIPGLRGRRWDLSAGSGLRMLPWSPDLCLFSCIWGCSVYGALSLSLFVQYQEDASDIKDMSKYKPHILLSQENTQIRDLQQENRG